MTAAGGVEADQLRLLTLSAIENIGAVFDTLEKTAPPFGPHFLFREVGYALKVIQASYVEVIASYSQGAIDAREFCDKTEVHLAALRWLHAEIFPYLEHMDTTFVPVEIQLTAVAIGRRVLTRPFALSFYPTWVFDYELHAWRNLSTSFLDHFRHNLPPSALTELSPPSRTPDWAVMLDYPTMEARNALLHVNIMHELAHLVEREREFASSFLSSLPVETDDLKRLLQPGSRSQRSAGEQQASGQVDEEEKVAVYKAYVQILESWLREMCCDLMAVRLAGPAYFFAFLQNCLLAHAMERETNSHPPGRARLRWVLRELEKAGYMSENPASKVVASHLRAWKELLAPVARRSEDLFFREALKTLEAANDAVSAGIAEALPGGAAFDMASLGEAERVAAESFAKGIARSDTWDGLTNRPLCPMVLMNAAWIACLDHLDALASAVGAGGNRDSARVRARSSLEELLLKALESSEILAVWKAGGLVGR